MFLFLSRALQEKKVVTKLLAFPLMSHHLCAQPIGCAHRAHMVPQVKCAPLLLENEFFPLGQKKPWG